MLPVLSKGQGLSDAQRLLRGSVVSLKQTQDTKDFHDSYKRLSIRTGSLAIADIVDSHKIPIFHDKHSEYDTASFNKKSLEALNSSSVFKALTSFDPSISFLDSSLSLKKQSVRFSKKKMIDDDVKNKRLSEALEMMEQARKKKNESSLSIYFRAGVIFDEIEIYPKAIEAFRKAAKVVPAEIIVDQFLLPDDDVHKRKIERLGGKPLEDYINKRRQMREMLIFDETERQRLRRIVAYCQHIRLYIILQDYRRAQEALTSAFSLTNQPSEHYELLRYTHDLFKNNWVKLFLSFTFIKPYRI
jgi:tetratricopeptide (TPR) repeat protein